MKLGIISGLAVISSFALIGLAKSGEVLVDPALKDVQQFLKGNFDNPALNHLPTAGPNYKAQTTTFVGQPIVVQNEVKLLESPPPAQSTPTAEYGPVDKSDVSFSHITHKSPDKISVTILKEFSLGAVPGSKGSHINTDIQYTQHSPSPDSHIQHSPPPQHSYGTEQLGDPGSQVYKSPPIQEFIDQHTQYSIGTSYGIKNQNIEENNQYNQGSLQQENNGYGQPEQQSQNIGYQNNQQQTGGYDQQQQSGGYQQQEQQSGGYQQQEQQSGGYQQQEQQSGGYQNQQPQSGGYQNQQQQSGGYQDQQQQQIGGYQNQQQQSGGYQDQQQQQIGGYQNQQQQSGGYQDQQQQQIGGYQNQQQQQQIGGYDVVKANADYSNQQASIQQQSTGGYNNQVSNQQQSNGGYNQKPSSQDIQQPQNNGGYTQQNSALFQRQENSNGQGVIQQAQLQTHGQLLQQSSQKLVQSLGFGPVLEQADLVFKLESPEQGDTKGQGNGGYQQEQEAVPIPQSSNQYGAPNQPQNPNSQYGAPAQSQNPNSQYGAPAQSQNPTSQYGAPGQSQNPTSQYGAPNQSQNPNSQYGAPAQSQNPTSQYGAPGQSQNSKSPMEGWTIIKPQFARSHYAKGGDQSSWTPKVANLAQGGYSDNINQATKDFRVNNLVVDKSGVIQSYNSDKTAKVVIHAQNVIIKGDIPVDQTNIVGNHGNSRDITPLLKEQLKALLNGRAQQQQRDPSITAKTNAFVAIPNYFKPSNDKQPLPNNLGNNGAGGYAYQANSGYNLATSVQQASAYSNNVNKFQNSQTKSPSAQQIPNDYGAGLQPPLPYAAASNNVKVGAGPPKDYNAALSVPPLGSSASNSNNNYAPPPVPTAFTNTASQSLPKIKSLPNDYHSGLYAPPPLLNAGSSHIPEGKIVGEPVPLRSQYNGNSIPPRGKGPPRFKNEKRPGSIRDYGSSVSYFGKSRPKFQNLKDSESQYSHSVEQQENPENFSVNFGNGNEHPFAHLATKRPPGFRNFTDKEKFRYRTKRPKLFSISYGDEEKRPEKIVQGPSIDLQGIITSDSNTKSNYKYRETSSSLKENTKSHGSGYSVEFTDPYTRLGKDLFYSVYDMIKKNTPSFRTIASIPRAITSTMKGIKIPPVRLEIYRN